jgi:hypothetical protein
MRGWVEQKRLSFTMLVGATINSLRHELHDTGELPYAISE